MATLDWLPKHIVVIIFLWSTLIVKDLNGFIYLTRMFTLSSFEVDVELNLFDILIGKKILARNFDYKSFIFNACKIYW